MFFYVLIFVITTIIILLLSKIKIDIQNIKISTEKYAGRILFPNYKITVVLYIIKKAPILKINITKKNLEQLKLKSKIKEIIKKIDIQDIKEKSKIDREKLKDVKKVKPKIEKLNLKMNIGTEDAALTSYIVAVVSSVIGILLRKQLDNYSENKFIVNPVYINKNLLNLELDCIFTIKMIHIIYIIYILKKKRRVDTDVRTSNRRSYGYSYE